MLSKGAKIAEIQHCGSEIADALVQSYLDLAEAAFDLGLVGQAADILGRAVEAGSKLGGDEQRNARVLNCLGVIRSRQEPGEAERLFKRAIAILEQAGMPSGPEVARFLANLGAVYRQIGKASQARAAFGRALSISEACLGANHLSVAWNLDQIGDLEAHEGNLPAAIFAFCRALAIKERTAGPDSWEAGVTLNKLCDVYFKQGRYNDAESFLLRVLGIRERALGWHDPALARPLTWLGRIYARQRKDGRAEHLVRYALKLFLDVLPSSHPDIIDCLRLLSEVYRGLGRYKDADAVWTLAQGLVDGTASSEKLGRYVFAEPPRICESSALVFGVSEVPS